MRVTSGSQRHRAHLGRHGDYSRETTLDSGGLPGSGKAGSINVLSHCKEVGMRGLWVQLCLSLWGVVFLTGSLGNEAGISEFPLNLKIS